MAARGPAGGVIGVPLTPSTQRVASRLASMALRSIVLIMCVVLRQRRRVLRDSESSSKDPEHEERLRRALVLDLCANQTMSRVRRKNLIHAQHLTSYLTGSFSKYCVWAQICGAINSPRTKAYVCRPIAKR